MRTRIPGADLAATPCYSRVIGHDSRRSFESHARLRATRVCVKERRNARSYAFVTPRSLAVLAAMQQNRCDRCASQSSIVYFLGDGRQTARARRGLSGDLCGKRAVPISATPLVCFVCVNAPNSSPVPSGNGVGLHAHRPCWPHACPKTANRPEPVTSVSARVVGAERPWRRRPDRAASSGGR
jgi:hypothetical protein